MQPTILRIPLVHLTENGVILTRDSVIDLADRCGPEGPAREVKIIITVDHDDGDIEVASIELNSGADGSWRLQYVSHPAQCGGLTMWITPTTSDFSFFIQKLCRQQHASPISAISAQELQVEGLGPLAILNLRGGHQVPVVPTSADLAQFMEMIDVESCNLRNYTSLY